MSFADLILAQREREEAKTRLDDDARIRAQAELRVTKRLGVSDAQVIEAFKADAARARRRGSDPEPALKFAESRMRKAA